MSKALFFVLACALVVAALAEFDEDEDTDLELFEAEKRGLGRNMKKYKYCQQFNMDCWCNRRSKKVVFCNGAANGDSM